MNYIRKKKFCNISVMSHSQDKYYEKSSSILMIIPIEKGFTMKLQLLIVNMFNQSIAYNEIYSS